MAFRFSERSLKALNGVHPDLVAVVHRALELSTVDFTVVEGLRSLERQKQYYSQGASRTMKSYHLMQSTGYGHAVDLYPYFDGSVQVSAVDKYWKAIATAMKAAAAELSVRITWGGDWSSFVDMPHFQIEVE